MKKTVLLIALFLGAGLLAQAQTYSINDSLGIITSGCSSGPNGIVYENNVNATWNVNIGQSKYVKIEYDVNIEPNRDFVEIYCIVPGVGYLSHLCSLTGTLSGTIYSHIPNGQIKIVFITNGSVSCKSDPGYGWTGFDIWFSPDDRTKYDKPAVFQGQVYFNESVSGSLQGRALRIQTNYGNLDLGPQNSDFAHLSTDREGFLFNKPLYLQNGTGIQSSSFGGGLYKGLQFQAGGENSMVIYPNGNVGIGPPFFPPDNRLEVNGNMNVSGNIGIGTTFPNTKLEVQGSVYLPSGNSYWIGSYSDSGNRLRMHHNGSTAMIDYAPNLYLRSGTNPVATFLNNGKVGIGTANPESLLDVNGSVTVDGNICVGRFRGYEGVPPGYGKRVTFGNFENYDDIWIARYNVMPHDSELRVNIGTHLYNDRFVVGTEFWEDSNWYEHFVVRGNGNVGIGVSYPGVKLDVNGIIRAHEVKLCLNQGCDYVFADDYKLMNLSDLSDFIKTNKHLPEVAPAAEMETEGINLSEMQAKLLQKIEELTLYVIEQDKSIQDLKRANTDLKDEVNKLKNIK